MDIKPIRTEADYKAALTRIETLMDAREGTPDGDLLDVLVTLVDAYERKHYPVDLPDPVSAIKFYMEQNGLAPKDMEPALGRLNRVYEVLNAKRPLSAEMALLIGQALDLDAEPLLGLQMKYNLLSAKRNKSFLERLKEIPRIAAVF